MVKGDLRTFKFNLAMLRSAFEEYYKVETDLSKTDKIIRNVSKLAKYIKVETCILKSLGDCDKK